MKYEEGRSKIGKVGKDQTEHKQKCRRKKKS